MRNVFEAVKVTEKVYWVGAIDWTLKDFHGYSTHRGSTYNAYLVLADRVTLIDTVKAPFRDELLSRINSVIDPNRIDYVISNHSEMDHTGSLPEIIDALKPEKVFASKMGVKAIENHFGSMGVEAVEDLSELDLGGLKVKFIETRMLHWPDSMFSYIPEDRLLISQDGFGQHWATGERFDDEVDQSELFKQAAKYYANIILPYSARVKSVLKDVREKGFVFDMIATDHAPHSSLEKEVEFDQAAFGIIGLETSLPLSLALVFNGHISLEELVMKMSRNPARLLGIDNEIRKGNSADFTIIDLERSHVINADKFVSKSRNTPFNGMKVRGDVFMTMVGGRIVYSREDTP